MKGSGANHYPRATAQMKEETQTQVFALILGVIMFRGGGDWGTEWKKQGKFDFGSETFLMRIYLWLMFLLVHFYPKTRRGYLRFGVSQSVTGRAALRYEETGQYNK